jgi:hypothetical protein
MSSTENLAQFIRKSYSYLEQREQIENMQNRIVNVYRAYSPNPEKYGYDLHVCFERLENTLKSAKSMIDLVREARIGGTLQSNSTLLEKLPEIDQVFKDLSHVGYLEIRSELGHRNIFGKDYIEKSVAKGKIPSRLKHRIPNALEELTRIDLKIVEISKAFGAEDMQDSQPNEVEN